MPQDSRIDLFKAALAKCRLVVRFADLPSLLHVVQPVVEINALRAKIGEAFADAPSAYTVAYCPASEDLHEGAYHVVPVMIGDTPGLALILVVNEDVLSAVEAGLNP